MAKLSKAELEAFVASYVDPDKTNAAYTASIEDYTGLIEKVGKQITLDNPFLDKLPEFDSEELPLGKIIEEYYVDLCMPVDFDPTGANVDAPSDATFREPSYSYPLGKKSFKQTIRDDEYEKAMLSTTTESQLVTKILERLYDSEVAYKFQIKKQMLGNLIEKVLGAQSTTGLSNFAAETAYDVMDRVKDASGNVYVCVKACKSTTYPSGDDIDDAVEGGTFVKYDMINVLAKPEDTSTGEAFIKQIKNDVEEASFMSEGHSLAGNTLGAADGLSLYILKGIQASLDVDTLAGVFNIDKLDMPVNIKVLDNFGDDKSGTYAILTDARGIKLYTASRSVKARENEEGDFINHWIKDDFTAFQSNFTFVKVYKAS